MFPLTEVMSQVVHRIGPEDDGPGPLSVGTGDQARIEGVANASTHCGPVNNLPPYLVGLPLQSRNEGRSLLAKCT